MNINRLLTFIFVLLAVLAIVATYYKYVVLNDYEVFLSEEEEEYLE